MKALRLLALLVLGGVGLAQAPVRVLFIGNSHTYGHNVPQMVADLSRLAGGVPIEFEAITGGDYSLEQHWRLGSQAARLMQELAWNTVQRLR
jgi:hypothetical protein